VHEAHSDDRVDKGLQTLLAIGQFPKLWDDTATQSGLAAHTRESEMASTLGDPPSLTNSDVDALTWQFLNSAYADDTYADWPLDRRIEGFLRRRGLAQLAEDGDAQGLILNRAMAYIAVRARA
jgi:hypothetical protein